MKTLLVPTDFSQHAFNAALYAAGMATERGWKLHMLHVYDAYYAVSVYPGVTGAAWAEIMNAADEQLASLIAKLQKQFPSISVSGENREGTVGGTVAKVAAEKAIGLVIMGTHGATGLKYTMMGSNTYAVIRSSPVPVAAIPRGISTFLMDRVGFAVNYHPSEITALESFTELIGRPTDITLFHLYEKGKQEETKKLQKWERRFEKITSGSGSILHFTLAVSRNLPVGINRMVYREQLDALVMTPVDKTFFNRLFSKQLVKAVAHRPIVPVFFMKGAGK